LLSFVCTSLNELLAGWRRWRGHTLKAGIDNLIGSKLSGNLYKHPLVKGLSQASKLPSYIPSETFTLALLDTVTQGKALTPANIKKAAAGLPEDINRYCSSFLRTPETKWLHFVNGSFFGTAPPWTGFPDRISAKRRPGCWSLQLSSPLQPNADTILLAKALAQDTILRERIVAQAEKFSRAQSQQAASVLNPELQTEEFDTRRQEADAKDTTAEFRALGDTGLPLGWNLKKGDVRDLPRNPMAAALKVLGLGITVFAVSLGAPFWFDLMKKIVTVRSTGKSPAESVKVNKLLCLSIGRNRCYYFVNSPASCAGGHSLKLSYPRAFMASSVGTLPVCVRNTALT